jgi:hypothetical protein
MDDKLREICKKFIEKHRISCSEAISQEDSIIVDAYDFIKEICDEVGYYEYPEE